MKLQYKIREFFNENYQIITALGGFVIWLVVVTFIGKFIYYLIWD